MAKNYREVGLDRNSTKKKQNRSNDYDKIIDPRHKQIRQACILTETRS